MLLEEICKLGKLEALKEILNSDENIDEKHPF